MHWLYAKSLIRTDLSKNRIVVGGFWKIEDITIYCQDFIYKIYFQNVKNTSGSI